MAGKLHAQAAHIHALLAQLGYFFQRSDRIPGGNGITDFKQVSPVCDACHTADKSFINLVVNTGAGVQNGQRITHGTISQTADELRGVLVELDFFLLGHIQQTFCNIVRRDAGKIIPLATA